MRKNVAGQTISVNMATASDGSVFAGAVTCYVNVDGAGQVAGQGASPQGSCNYMGNGEHQYTPTQGETNGEHIAFTFTGSGAVAVTINVYPRLMTLVEETALAAAASGLELGSVQSGATTTSIPTDLTETTPQHYNGAALTFLTGALAKQRTDITGYTSDGVLTVTALTEAPAPGDTFVIS